MQQTHTARIDIALDAGAELPTLRVISQRYQAGGVTAAVQAVRGAG
ncbi:hypothetical protein [Janthinobacterium sp. HLX7-2]